MIIFHVGGLIHSVIYDAEKFDHVSRAQVILSEFVIPEIDETRKLCADLKFYAHKIDDQGQKRYRIIAGVLKVALNWREAMPADLLAQGETPPLYNQPEYSTAALPAEVTPEFVENKEPFFKDLKAQSDDAIIGNDTFLALASPTAAQTLTQVKDLTRQSTRVIKALRRLVMLHSSG